MTPKRIQRKRTKGWKMPENTISVTRPGKWGNPFKIGDYAYVGTGGDGIVFMKTTKEYATNKYVHLDNIDKVLEVYERYLKVYRVEQVRELKGKNLACFCKEGEKCHADILLKLANE